MIDVGRESGALMKKNQREKGKSQQEVITQQAVDQYKQLLNNAIQLIKVEANQPATLPTENERKLFAAVNELTQWWIETIYPDTIDKNKFVQDIYPTWQQLRRVIQIYNDIPYKNPEPVRVLRYVVRMLDRKAAAMSEQPSHHDDPYYV